MNLENLDLLSDWNNLFYLFTGQDIITELANDPKLVFHCGITPRKLPVCDSFSGRWFFSFFFFSCDLVSYSQQLVEHNPQIAVEILTKLNNSTEINE